MYLYETTTGPIIQYCVRPGSHMYRRYLEVDGLDQFEWLFWELLENSPILKDCPKRFKIDGVTVNRIARDFEHPGRDKRTGLHKLMRMVRKAPIFESASSE